MNKMRRFHQFRRPSGPPSVQTNPALLPREQQISLLGQQRPVSGIRREFPAASGLRQAPQQTPRQFVARPLPPTLQPQQGTPILRPPMRPPGTPPRTLLSGTSLQHGGEIKQGQEHSSPRVGLRQLRPSSSHTRSSIFRGKAKKRGIIAVSAVGLVSLLAILGLVGWFAMQSNPDVTVYRVGEHTLTSSIGGGGIISFK